MNSYEERQQRRRERLERRAERLRQEGASRIARAQEMGSVIPMGQPILIGHHSEKRDRAYRAKIHTNFSKGFEAIKAADEVERRAESVGCGGISSDDPDGVAKLKERLESLQADQAQMTAINAAWRKAGKPKANVTEAWARIAELLGAAVRPGDLERVRVDMARDFIDRAPFTYQLSNNSGNMRRIELRIAELSRKPTETKETEHDGGIRVVENADENRLQIFFPDKPADEVRASLKSCGFKWSPNAGAWQRQLNNSARWSAEHVLSKLKKEG